MADKLDKVHPDLAARVRHLLEAMALLGHPMKVTDGLRTAEEQQALFAKGRTIKGEPPYTPDDPLGRTVTFADGVVKKSNHQGGKAVDCTFFHNGKVCWCEKHPWLLYGEAAKALGLKWGGDWPTPKTDRPHLELP